MPTPDLIPLLPVDQAIFDYVSSRAAPVTLLSPPAFVLNATQEVVLECQRTGRLRLGTAAPLVNGHFRFWGRHDDRVADFTAQLSCLQAVHANRRLCRDLQASAGVLALMDDMIENLRRRLDILQKVLERRIVHFTVWCDEQTEDHAGREMIFSPDYAYFSSFSTSWLAHARQYVEQMVRRFGLNAESCVVEVAANDGYLLQYVKQAGIPCFGIEPTAGTARAAREKGGGPARRRERARRGRDASATARGCGPSPWARPGPPAPSSRQGGATG